VHNGLEWSIPAPGGRRQYRFTGRLKAPYTSVAELWETLAARGVIPDGWASDGSRRFYGTQGRGLPASGRAALVFASDPEGITQAEALGREVAHRLAAWVVPRSPQPVWKVASREELASVTDMLPGGKALRAVASVTGEPVERLVYQAALAQATPRRRRSLAGANVPSVLPIEVLAQALARSAALYRGRCAGFTFGATVRLAEGEVAVPDAWQGRPLSALPDPFEPLLRLWNMGYGLWDINHRAITLLAQLV
jgi:hypothetical protein